MPFVIPLSPAGGPLTRQIYLWFRDAVLSGTLKPGERIASTRILSEELRVSRTVVLLAFDQLLAEGFFEGRKGSGTFVSRRIVAQSKQLPQETAPVRLSRFGRVAAAFDPAQAVRRSAGLPWDFRPGTGTTDTFPFEAWRRILMRRARAATVHAHDYGPSSGSNSLRVAIANHLRRSRAVDCEPDQIVIVNGSQQALDLTVRVLVNPGETVVIEDPHYAGAREVLQAAGARLFPVPVDDEGLNPQLLPQGARLAFVTPSHQFPTGAILPLARRFALLEWAKQADAVILEDDYDGEFRYDGRPVESVQGIDREGRVVYTGTFSRTIFPALRIGYLVAPKRLVPAFAAAKWLCDRHTATLEQDTLAEFLESGAYERHLARTRRVNASRRRALLEAIAENLGGRVRVTGAGAGAHVVLWPGAGVSEEAFVRSAAVRGVGIYGMGRYYLNGSGPAAALLGYTRMNEAMIREGIRRMALSDSAVFTL